MKLILILAILASTSAYSANGVKAYFNHNQKSQYTEPYRGITRQGDNLEAVILAEILAAKKSVYMAVQELRLPLIAQALILKKNMGVDVRVILEHDYNFNVTVQRDTQDTNEHDASKLSELYAFVDADRNNRISQQELLARDAIYMLQTAQIPLIDDTFDASKGSGLMHHKFVIVDGKSTLISSANFTMSCVHGDTLNPRSRGNPNSLVVVQSANVAKLFTEEFAQMWGNGRRGNFGQNKTYRAAQTISVGGVNLSIQFSPTTQRITYEESVNGLIAKNLNKATRSIKAALFVFSDQNLGNVMEARHAAGADVGAVVEPKFAYREYSEVLDMLGIRMLGNTCKFEADNRPWAKPVREAGMGRLASGDVLHHKFAVVDNRITIMGSQNWSAAANYINDETMVVIEDAGISELYGQEYARLKKDAFLGVSGPLMTEVNRREQECANLGFHY